MAKSPSPRRGSKSAASRGQAKNPPKPLRPAKARTTAAKKGGSSAKAGRGKSTRGGKSPAQAVAAIAPAMSAAPAASAGGEAAPLPVTFAGIATGQSAAESLAISTLAATAAGSTLAASVAAVVPAARDPEAHLLPQTQAQGVAALGNDAAALRQSILYHLQSTLAKDQYTATRRDYYQALALAVRDRLVSGWIRTQQRYYQHDGKRVYYLSLEFLLGRSLGDHLINLGLEDAAHEAVAGLGLNLGQLAEMEEDAGLGNGGLGRLAACFLESMATLGLPAYGYGIRYEYGIFFQHIRDGYQIETPDNWLRYGNAWEIGRPERLYPVRFYGRVQERLDEKGRLCCDWVDTQLVMAMAYDVPVPGYSNGTVNTLRLWSAKSSREFDLGYFNHGDYVLAVEDKNRTENISRVLYPNDNIFEGKELRLKQEYFLVAATIQDIVRRYRKGHADFEQFSEKVAIQLNDTHPSLAVPELMRILVDQEAMTWERAWEITTATCAYTNHTILPEALEKWPVDLLARVLPRHLQIIFEINRRFLDHVDSRFPGDGELQRRMSLIEEGSEKRVRMAHLAIVGGHRVNGVSALHGTILQQELFRDFHLLDPQKIIAITNGITPRRWLSKANAPLAQLITSRIGPAWKRDLNQLTALEPLAEDGHFRTAWAAVKAGAKGRLAELIRRELGLQVNADSLFDVQVKRIHEYKRQLLNVLHVISLYQQIKDEPSRAMLPRTVIFAGKAAPGYAAAKLIIKLIHSVAAVINNDADAAGKLALVFLPNYRVTLAETIIPGADLSEQISTAGTEASGTGNMKFALNGGLTIGTLDGANVEIRAAVGDENIFIFGLTAPEAQGLRRSGYSPWDYYHTQARLQHAVDALGDGSFSGGDKGLFQPLAHGLLQGGDPYLLLADFAAYLQCQEQVSAAYLDRDRWWRASILNVARVGRFSADQTIGIYADKVWNAAPVW